MMGIFDIVGTTASGWLTDRYSARHLLFGYYALRGLSLLFLPMTLLTGGAGLGFFAVFYGLDWIATVPPTVRLTTETFGRENTGVDLRLDRREPPDRRVAGGVRRRRDSHRARRLPPGVPHRRPAVSRRRRVVPHGGTPGPAPGGADSQRRLSARLAGAGQGLMTTMDLQPPQPVVIVCGRPLAAALTGAVLMAALVAAQRGVAPSAPHVSMHVPVPPPLVVTDGMPRLLYELHIENRGADPVTLSGIEVRPDAPPVTLTIDGEPLIRALDVPANRAAPLLVPAGGRRVAYLDIGVTYDRRGMPIPPRRVRHRVRVTVAGGAVDIVDDGDGIGVDPRVPVVLGPPLAGGPWVAVHHPEWERGHRRVFYTVDGRARLPGRFTIDWVKVDDAGRTTRGDADIVTDSLGYGADVLAVADATAAAARDTIPEVARISERRKHPQDEAAGNFVSLDLGNGRFAVYEHLKPGSVRVQPGQRVRRGDVIAQLGFTGDSTGPHLHLHVGDAASPLGAEGLPFVFERFGVLGRYPDIAAMGTARWSVDGAGRRTNERPGSNVVVDFGNAHPR